MVPLPVFQSVADAWYCSAGIQTKAVKQGDHYVINGSKVRSLSFPGVRARLY
jgi:hypothetical protein